MNDAKRHLLSLLSTGHKHDEMTKALNCDYCGVKFKKAQAEFTRLYRQHPEEFQVKQEDYTSPKVLEMEQQLDDRIKNDSLYQKHLRTLYKGSPEEKKREVKKFWGGYYEKNVGDNIRKTWN